MRGARVVGLLAIAFLVGCGGGGGGDGGGFSIRNDLAKVINVYGIPDGEMGITFDPTTDQGLGAINRTTSVLFDFAGPVASRDSFNITLHVSDTDNNGSVSDEVGIPASGTAVLSNDGQHAAVHYTITILGIEAPFDFDADLVRTVQKG